MTAPAASGAAADADGLVAVGVVRGAYGIKGWARVAPFERNGEALGAATEWHVGSRHVTVEAVRRHGVGWVAKWSGFSDPESVEALKGCEVRIARAAFPPVRGGETYWVDLIGATVVNRSQETLGRVSGVRNNGAHDLIELQGEDGRLLLIPVIETYVDSIDAAAGLVKVDWERDWA